MEMIVNIIPLALYLTKIRHEVFEYITGWGTNEDLIIQILAHRNAAQRKLIREVYAATYGDDLLKDLDAELSSDFQVTFRLLCFV